MSNYQKPLSTSLLTSHEICEVAECLPEDHIPMFRYTFLKLFLQISATVLIFAQGRYFSLQILQACTCKTIDWYIMSVKSTRNLTEDIHSRSMSPRLCFGPC